MADGDKLCAVQFHGQHSGYAEAAQRATPFLKSAARQLREYFSGQRQQFDLPLAPGGTAFQRQVWTALTRIPYGEVASYGDIARDIGKPSAARAVGAANGRNPLPIIVPCHRIIGSNGKLTGFAGGLQAKRALLTLEGAI